MEGLSWEAVVAAVPRWDSWNGGIGRLRTSLGVPPWDSGRS